jgi:hypothetical protein
LVQGGKSMSQDAACGRPTGAGVGELAFPAKTVYISLKFLIVR